MWEGLTEQKRSSDAGRLPGVKEYKETSRSALRVLNITYMFVTVASCVLSSLVLVAHKYISVLPSNPFTAHQRLSTMHIHDRQ